MIVVSKTFATRLGCGGSKYTIVDLSLYVPYRHSLLAETYLTLIRHWVSHKTFTPSYHRLQKYKRKKR